MSDEVIEQKCIDVEKHFLSLDILKMTPREIYDAGFSKGGFVALDL